MRIMLLAGGLLLTTPAPAFAEAWDFVLVNNTGKSIKLVEVSPAGAADWKPDIRDEDRKSGSSTPGQRHTIHFEKDDKACKIDVRMTFEDEDAPVIWSGFDVCKFAFGDFSLKGDVPVVKGS